MAWPCVAFREGTLVASFKHNTSFSSMVFYLLASGGLDSVLTYNSSLVTELDHRRRLVCELDFGEGNTKTLQTHHASILL